MKKRILAGAISAMAIMTALTGCGLGSSDAADGSEVEVAAGAERSIYDEWKVLEMPGDLAAEASSAEEDDATDMYSVELTEVGPNKVKVIKVVREKTGLGLKEAKDLVEAAPCVVLEDVSMEEAEAFKEALEAEEATVTIK